MARQGNYVTLASANPNWASGVSGALADLSRSLTSQSDAEKERDRLAAADIENKRRYAEDKAFKEAAAAEDTRRYAADANYKLVKDAEDRRRFDNDANYKLAKDAEDRRRFDKDYALRAGIEADRKAEKERNRISREVGWEYSDPSKQEFTLEEYPEHLRKSFRTLLDSVDKEKDATIAYLSGSKGPEDILSAYRTNLEVSGLTKTAVDEAVKQRGLELRGFKNELEFGGYTPEQAADRVNSLVVKDYDSRAAEVESKIRSGAGLTQEDKVDALLRRIPANMRGSVDRAVLADTLKQVVQGPTREGLKTTEEARVKQANDAVLKNIDLYDKYLDQANAGKGQYTKNSQGVAKALGAMGGIDLKFGNTEAAKKGFEALLADDISPEIAAAATMYGIEDGLWKSFPDLGSKEFAELRLQAKLLQGGRSVDSKGKVFIDPKAYTYKPEQVRGLEELQRRSVGFSGFKRTPIAVDPRFSLTGELPSGSVYAAVNRDSYGPGTASSAAGVVGRVINSPAPSTPIGRYRRNELQRQFTDASKELSTLNRRIEEAQKDGGYYATSRLNDYLVERDRLQLQVQRIADRIE